MKIDRFSSIFRPSGRELHEMSQEDIYSSLTVETHHSYA